MKTYKLTLSYDGGRYLGWHRIASNDNTIQFILENSIGRLAGHRVLVEGAGITQPGAHARAQIASVRLEKNYDVQKLKTFLNRALPDDIRIQDIEIMPDGFQAKKDAIGFKYEYYVDNRERADVFYRRFCYHYPEKLDLKAMQMAADAMVGTRDFSSFTTQEECPNPVCTLSAVQIMCNQDKIRFTYFGSEFLDNMVEILTGTLLEIGAGKKKLSMVPVIIAAQDRNAAGFTAPSKGVFLSEVIY
ncbi:MAG: tRNA pseudouridine synthase A [Dorea sp.]|nr:tRNA pseudouridine synthase A [Dorea sp.]